MIEEKSRRLDIFLLDGTAQGRIKCKLANWTGVAYKIPRIFVNVCKTSQYDVKKHLSFSGVYFLFGRKDDDLEKPIVYIGQSQERQNGESFLTRWQEHMKVREKDYWTEAIAITTSDNSFGPTELSFLEHNFYKLASNAKRYDLGNGNTPPEGNVTEEKRCELEEFIEYSKIVMGVLGHNIFEPKSMVVSIDDNGSEEKTIKFYINNNKATAIQTTEGFCVLAGSKIGKSAAKTRTKYPSLINNGELIDDIVFSSPTAAADFILGYHVNGKEKWKTAEGKTLNDLGK